MTMKKRNLTGSPSDAVTSRETEHRQLSRIAAAEGMVLLRNIENTLPIAKGSRIALYGAGAEITIKGGIGSGDVNSRDTVSVRQGLEQAGYQLTSLDWLNDFRALYERQRLIWRDTILNAFAQPEYNGNFFRAYTEHPFAIPCGRPLTQAEMTSGTNDTAIFVLSRCAGEAADRKDEPGDYQLTAEEHALLMQISQAHAKVVLVLNTGSLIDLSFTDTIPNITAILYMVQGGQESGSALADLISGDVVPSGKLTDSWTYRYEDYPNAEFFGSRFCDAWKAEYREDIYVGYRYFDTFQVPVRYGFGFGLSYTEFFLTPGKLSSEGCNISVEVDVKNIGNRFSGKEVVQLYVSCPQDTMQREFRRLCCFGKTDLLAPGESQHMLLSFDADALSSYDKAAAAWILTEGTYGIWVGNSLEQAALIGSIAVDRTAALTNCGHICPLQDEIPLLQPDREALLARQREWLTAAEKLPRCTISAAELPTKTISYDALPAPTDSDLYRMTEALDDEQLIALSTGRLRTGTGELGNAGQTVPGAAAETVSILASDPWNVPSIVLADGPAGLRLKKVYQVIDGHPDPGTIQDSVENGFFSTQQPEGTSYYQFCTAIPVGALLAQTWNLPLLREIGKMIGSEMLEFEVTLWLAPGLNIHRNPLCGRNFEYYSEDPLVSGMVAAAITQGVQSVPGCGTTIKHLACNNQEDKRKGSDSILSERALREIYLKGFEIAVKASQPMAIMTSYNMVNGIHAANSHDLCTKAARNEWGFDGLIMTDWTTTTTSLAGECTAAGCILAGNGLVMPGASQDHESIRDALNTGKLSRVQLVRCVYDTIRISLLSNQMEKPDSYGNQYPVIAPMHCE